MNVVQRYAVLMAKDGVGFVCRKQGGSTDLNTVSMGNVKKLKLEIEKRNNGAIDNDNSTNASDFSKLQDNAKGCHCAYLWI